MMHPMANQAESTCGERLRWGVLGTGRIARRFAEALRVSRRGTLHAVASRTMQAGRVFADQVPVPRIHVGYDALLGDAHVQAVYIALPNHLHAPWAIAAAEAGKDILLEKPFALSAAQCDAVLNAVQLRGVFLMEGFMYRGHSNTKRLCEAIRGGVIGQVKLIETVFASAMNLAPDNIRLRNEAGGGAIMDLGCYCVSMARLIAGAARNRDFDDPIRVEGVGVIDRNDHVDHQAVASLEFAGGIIAQCLAGIRVPVGKIARIWGTEGHIEVNNPWFPNAEDNQIVCVDRGGNRQTISQPDPSNLYAQEADAVAAYRDKGQAAPPYLSWDDSRGNQRTIDRWLACIGLRFPDQDRTQFSGDPAGMDPQP